MNLYCLYCFATNQYLQSEGLLILTADGEYARQMELPDNGLVRRYRARVTNGIPTEKDTFRLGKGISVRQSLLPYKVLIFCVFEWINK